MPFIGNNQNAKKEYEKSAYQQNVSQPIEIDKPVQSARQETLGKIYKIAETNPEKARNLYGLYEESCRTPGTPVYNQYAQPTNQAVGELAKYGINANGMTTDWFKNNNSWQQYLIYNGTTNTPSKPGKKASDNEWKAYWTYQIYKSAEDTDKAEREWAALKQEISWKAKNPGRNDSDDEIINGIDWKKYPTLAKMQETEGINPVELNRGIGFSKDDMYGVAWAARNGYEGDNSDYAIAMGALGQGNVWQENAELRAKLNWNNRDTYSPYSAGMTLGSDVGMYFNMTAFNADDIERLRQTIDPNDATATAMFDRVWGAWENTQKAEAELKTLEDKVDRWIKQGKAKDTIIKLTEKHIDNNCPTLTKMDESIQNGSKLVETTKAINYKKQDFLAEVGKYCDEAGTKLKGEQFVADIEKDAAPVSAKPKTSGKAPAAPATPKLTEQEKAIIAEQDKALADAGTIVDEVGTPVEKTASVYSWSATFDSMKNAVQRVRDSFTGQVNGLIKSAVKSSISDTANAILTGSEVIASYEQGVAKLEEINKRCAELETALGDLIYSGMNESSFSRGSVEVNVDGVPRIVRAEYNNRTGEYEITSIARKDGQKIPSDSETFNKVMAEAQKRFASVKETRDRAMSVAGVAMSEEEKAMLEEYNALSNQRNSLVQTQNENTAAYNEAKDRQTAAEAKRTAVISMMEKAGVPAEELKVFEETGAVIDVLNGFTQYDPTVWESFNAYDLYAQAIAFEGADSYDKVFADAKEGDAKNRQELETALWILDYSERNGIDVPENIKGNINRYIAKLERDHKDFEYFSILQSKDFKEMAQRGRERVDAAGWDWGSFDGTIESQPAWSMLSDEQKDQLLGMMDTYDINDIAATFENMVANNAGDPVEDRLFGLFQAGNLMSNYEIDTYYYLLAKEGQEAADAYYNHLADSSYGALTVRSRDALEAGAKDLADQGFWGRRAADALSIIQAPAAAFGSFAYGVEYGVKKLAGQEVEYNPNNPWLSFNQFRTAARSEIQAEITRTYGEGSVAEKIFSTMQEIISNRGDSMMNMMAFGWLTNGMTSEMAQEFIGALPMAAGAAADVMAQAKERGASDAQAWMVGSIALLCEAGTEAISISNIKDAFKAGKEVTANTVREFLKNWVTEAGWSEAIGESLNNFFENAADEAFMGPLSEHARRVAELKEADPNMTDDEAEAQARREEFSSILHTAITSFLSPGMDVIPLAAGRVNYLRAKTKFAQKRGANVNILDVMKADNAIREQENTAAANEVSETMPAATEQTEQAEASEAAETAEAETVEAEATEETEAAETEDAQEEVSETPSETTEQEEQEATEAEAPQEEASEENVDTAVTEEETEDEKWERWGKEDFLKKPLAEYSLLLKAKYADAKEQTALLAGVFDEDGTDGSSEIAKATATALHDFLSDNSISKNTSLTLDILENLYDDAEYHKLDIKTLKQAICTAVLGGENSAAFEAFNSMKHQSVRGWFWTDRMHEESIAQKLVKSVEQDSADPAVQENIRKAVREYRVVEAEGRLIAENAEQVKVQLAAAKSLQEKADKAEDNLISAKYRMERRFYAMQASAEAVQKATQNMNNEPSKENKKALTTALAKHESNSIVYEQSQMEVENLTKISEDAAEASKYAQNEAMNTVRKAAEQLVAQEDQQRQQAAEQQKIEQEQQIEQERLAQEEEDRRTGKLAEDERRSLIDQQVDKLNLNEETAEKVRSQLYQFDQDLNIGKADTSKLLSDVDAALAMNAISRKLGVAIEVGSLPEGKDGRYSNGKIVLSDRLTVGQAMVEVALHEITHSLEKTKSYGKYKDTVMGILFNSPAAMEKAIQDKIDFYERNGVNLGDTPAQKRAAAEAEIVADFAKDSKTFANKQTIQRMMDAGLGGRIRNALHNVNQYLNNMKLSGDERVKAENLRRAERLYQKALNERANASAHPSAEQFSVNQFAEAAGLHYQETNITDENGNVIAKSGLYTADPSKDRNAKRVDKVTPKMIEGTPVGELTNAALALGTMNKETVGKVHKMFADLMTMCADLQDSNLVWEIAGSTLYSEFSAIKANSDKQYSNTVDFGTICTKTQAVINQLSRDMLRLGRGLTSKEILQVYNDVYNADLKVPCPVCYVFSRWLGVPSLLENIRQYQNRFLGEPGAEFDRATVQKQVDDFIKNAHKEYGIGKTDKELELYKENVSKSRNKAEDAVDRTNKKIAKEEAKIAGYEDKLKQNPLRNDWIRNKASAEKRLAALQEELANKKTALDNVEVEAYSKTINKKKADIEKSIKDKTIKIEGSDKGERGIMDDIRDRIKEGKPYEDLLKKREKIQGEIDDLYKKLREVDAYNWVTQALCKMDRDGNFVVDDDFVRTKDEVLLDLRRTGEFARDVKNWTYRSTRGAGMGKAILPYSGASIGDSVLGIGARSMANPFKDHDADKAFAALRDNIIKAKRQNLIGGQRFQSTSDFRPEWGLDYIMTFIEQQALGSNGQLYTKVNEAVPLYASVGIDTNCSIMPYADGYHFPEAGEVEKMSEQEKKSRVITFKDEDGNETTVVLDFSDVTGMPYEYAQPLSKAYDSVQMIMVGINDIHIRACLAGEEIDFVIPWHSSGNTKGQLQSMMKTVDETLTNSSDYTKVQTDQIAYKKDLETAHGKEERGEELTDHERDLLHKEELRDARERLITGKTLTATDIARIGESKYLTSLYERFMGTTLDGKELKHDPKYWVELPDGKGGTTSERVTLTSGQAEQIFPYEYWDTALPKAKADENGWRFVEYCQELGLVPRFSGGNQKNDDGSITRFGNFSGAVYDESGNITGYNRDKMAKGYWKTLIDRKMYDNKGNYREQQQIDASKVQAGQLERNAEGVRELKGSNIPVATEGANYSGAEAERKYQQADDAFRSRIEEKAANGDKQAQEDLKRMQAYDDAHATDIEQYDLSGDTNPNLELTEGEMLQMLKDAGLDYQDALNRGDTTAAQEDADFIEEYKNLESQRADIDEENTDMNEGEMLQLLKDAGALSEEDAAKYSISKPNDRSLVQDGTLTEKELNRLNLSDRGEGERQFNTVTSQKSDVFNERALQYLKDHNHYVQDTNSAELARAIQWINANATEDDPTGYQKSLGMVTSPSFNSLTKDGQARMVAMLGMAAAQGNTHDQVLLLRNYGKQGTNIAQALQARKLFSLMTPEGRMRAIDRVLANAAEGMKKGQKDVQLEFSDWVYRAAAAAESPQDFDRVRQAAMNELAEQIPASWKDRIRSIRMLSMLANPRTHIRNIIGNALFVPAVSMKNKLGAVMELGVKRGNKTKTLALRVPGEIRSFAKEIAKEQKGMLTGEAKYNEATVIKKAQSKLGGFLDALSTFNSNALEAEDWLFLKGHFTRAFGGWMQANKYTVDQVRNDQALMEKGVTYAIDEAQKATYRDFNKAASILNDASRKGGVVGFFVDAALPFKKTPANILRRGIEYSPVGIVKSLTVDMIRMKKGDLTPTQVLDHFCAGLSGTAITALGFLLAGSGMVSCGLDDDEDKLEKAKGAQEYAVNFGKVGNAVAEKLGVPKLFGEDVTFTMDWAAPMAMPFFVGAAIREQMEQGGTFEAEEVINAFGSITEPVFNLSMLDGVNTLFKTSQYDDTNTITQIGAKVLTNYATSYIPSVLGAISRTFFDDKQRKAFVKQGEGNGPMGTVRYAIEQAENKIPGLAQTNIAVRDIWGREKTTDLLERILENFILPGYISKIEDDPILNEMGRLYDATGDAGMIPKEDPEKKISWTKDKVKHEHVLTAEEWDKYKEVRNGTAHAELTELINNPDYQNATDDVRTKMIKDVWSHAGDVGKNALFPEYELTSKDAKSIAKDSKLASYKEEIIKALDAENYDAYDTMVEAIRAEYDDEAEADATIKTKLGNTYRDKWKDAYKNGDDARMLEIEDILEYTGFNFNIYGKGGWQEKVDDKEEERNNRSSLPPLNRQIASNGMSDVGFRKRYEGMEDYRGTIDIDNRLVVHNDDGSISTERSFSFYDEDSGKEVLIPTVIDGEIVSEDEAIDHYYETVRAGRPEHLGMFDTPEEATEYAMRLSKRQDQYYNR